MAPRVWLCKSNNRRLVRDIDGEVKKYPSFKLMMVL